MQTAADLMEMCDDVPASARGLEESGQTLVLYLERLPACLCVKAIVAHSRVRVQLS